MKRLINLLLLLGIAVTFVYAQNPEVLPAPNASAQEAPDFSLNEPGAAEWEALSTQKGNLLISANGKATGLTFVYTLYPQPASKYLTIELEGKRATRPTLYLTTTEGEDLNVSVVAPMTSRVHRLQLNLKNVPEGIYYLNVKVPGTGTSEGMPIIKMDSAPVLIQ